MTDFSQETPTASPREIPGLDPRVRVFRCLGFVDSWAVVTERFVIVIDTLVSPEAAGQVVTSVQPQLGEGRGLVVVNTHGDWDHTWGNALFDGATARFPAPIVGHAATTARFDLEKARPFLEESRKAHPGWYDTVDFRLPAITFESALTIEGGDLSLQLIPTPGHTPDHICVWIPQLRLLLAADAAELPMPYVGDPPSLPQLRRSLATMLDLEPRTVLYSHGGDITSPDLIRHNIWYFDEAERRIKDFRRSRGELDVEDMSAASIGWPLEEAMPKGLAIRDLFSVEFYRESHDRAVRAVAQNLD